jgi:hypothetical protein
MDTRQPTSMKTFDFNFEQIVDAAQDIIIVTKADPIDPPGPEIVYVNKAQIRGTEWQETSIATWAMVG